MKMIFRLPYTILLIPILLLGSACNFSQSTRVKFTPDEESLFTISFSYPATWNWIYSSYDDGIYEMISTDDPYLPGEMGMEKYRGAYILVELDSHPSLTVDNFLVSYLAGIELLEPLILVEDKSLTIDDHRAIWLTVRDNHPDFGSQPFIHEKINLIAKDRYYRIGLFIPEDEFNGPFHTEFKEMVESIKFQP